MRIQMEYLLEAVGRATLKIRMWEPVRVLLKKALGSLSSLIITLTLLP
jgi:hypothetical protein